MSEHETNGGAIRITNREVYDVVIQLRDRVAALERRVDDVLHENVELRKRTRGLELKFYGILAGLIGAMTLFLANAMEVIR